MPTILFYTHVHVRQLVHLGDNSLIDYATTARARARTLTVIIIAVSVDVVEQIRILTSYQDGLCHKRLTVNARRDVRMSKFVAHFTFPISLAFLVRWLDMSDPYSCRTSHSSDDR